MIVLEGVLTKAGFVEHKAMIGRARAADNQTNGRSQHQTWQRAIARAWDA
jgi:hypothetical protein